MVLRRIVRHVSQLGRHAWINPVDCAAFVRCKLSYGVDDPSGFAPLTDNLVTVVSLHRFNNVF